MGLGGIELLMEVEDEFGIVISSEEASRVCSVGDLLACVMLHRPRRRTRRSHAASAFFRLRSVLGELFAVPRQRVRPETRLCDLLPEGKSREEAWRMLGEQTGLRLPGLEVPKWLRVLIFTVGALSVVLVIIGLLRKAQVDLKPSLILMSLVLPIALKAIHRLTVWITRPFAQGVPRQCATVWMAARMYSDTTYSTLVNGSEPASEKEVLAILRPMISDLLCVEEKEITVEKRLVQDLGMR